MANNLFLNVYGWFELWWNLFQQDYHFFVQPAILINHAH